jgi:hypothetical protein
VKSAVFVLSTDEIYCCRFAETLAVNSHRTLRMKLALSFEMSEINHPATQRDNTDGLNRQSKCNRVRSLLWRSVRSQTMR